MSQIAINMVIDNMPRLRKAGAEAEIKQRGEDEIKQSYEQKIRGTAVAAYDSLSTVATAIDGDPVARRYLGIHSIKLFALNESSAYGRHVIGLHLKDIPIVVSAVNGLGPKVDHLVGYEFGSVKPCVTYNYSNISDSKTIESADELLREIEHHNPYISGDEILRFLKSMNEENISKMVEAAIR